MQFSGQAVGRFTGRPAVLTPPSSVEVGVVGRSHPRFYWSNRVLMQRLAPPYFVALRIALAAAAGTTISEMCPSTGRPRLLPTSFAKHPCSGRGTSQGSRLPYIFQIVPAAPLAPETVRRRDRKVRPLYVEPADAGDYELVLQFAGIKISQSLIAVNEQAICVYADSKL